METFISVYCELYSKKQINKIRFYYETFITYALHAAVV